MKLIETYIREAFMYSAVISALIPQENTHYFRISFCMRNHIVCGSELHLISQNISKNTWVYNNNYFRATPKRIRGMLG